MAHFHIKGLHPQYDGDHPIQLDDLTNRELHTIKKISGVRAAELQDSFVAGDNDLIVAFAIIALQRAGLVVSEDVIWDAPVGAIEFVADVEEEDSPLVQPSAPEKPDETNVRPLHSGRSSNGDGESPVNDPSPTGTPA